MEHIKYEGIAAMHNQVDLNKDVTVSEGNVYLTEITDDNGTREIHLKGIDLKEIYGKNKIYKITKEKQNGTDAPKIIVKKIKEKHELLFTKVQKKQRTEAETTRAMYGPGPVQHPGL